MANQEHLAELRKGIEAWSRWRKRNPGIRPDFGEADLPLADLCKADLRGVNLHQARFFSANLQGADLQGADLSSVDLRGADLDESIWRLRLRGAIQADLLITPRDESPIQVDNLEMAQFIYLLLNNKKIREVIDTIGKKAVLILGRFTRKRKGVLDAIREALRHFGYLPILFEFEKPSTRDTQETITTLAGMSRLIIADITDPKASHRNWGQSFPTFFRFPWPRCFKAVLNRGGCMTI